VRGKQQKKCKHTAYESAEEASAAAARAQGFRERDRVLWRRCPDCRKFQVYIVAAGQGDVRK
jgi:hypothetical protein